MFTDYLEIAIDYLLAVISASAVEAATSRRYAGRWHFSPEISEVVHLA